MDPADKTPNSERNQTDQSLQTERRNSDQAIAEKLVVIEEAADKVLERAREHADAVLDKAREKADEPGRPGPADSGAIARDRAAEDQTIQSERVAADELLRKERAEQGPSLAELLPLEREKTDRYLLTERARSDKELATRDDFLGIVSHDLRSLLHGIAMNSGLLSRSASNSDEGRRIVESSRQIQRYVARMNRLIGDLGDVVAIDAGKLSVRPEPCDVAALLDESVGAFAGAATQKGIILVAEPVQRPLFAELDHDRMLQVLANLIANALKFAPASGRIAVHAAQADEQVHISVIDTGPGIPENLLEAVFERFWHAGGNEQRGLGLGLYISRCIVQAHGGRIWAESRAGEGCAFHLEIPLTQAQGA
ncbi:MAG TPA: HAMP domain-containing sensor histidine kinase [Solimonas sp.]|nr:HAMP domain-containing sensor histidine kinase [Solimonas sp.]